MKKHIFLIFDMKLSFDPQVALEHRSNRPSRGEGHPLTPTEVLGTRQMRCSHVTSLLGFCFSMLGIQGTLKLPGVACSLNIAFVFLKGSRTRRRGLEQFGIM